MAAYFGEKKKKIMPGKRFTEIKLTEIGIRDTEKNNF